MQSSKRITQRFKIILETLQQNDVSFNDALELDLETIKSYFEEPDEAFFNQFWEALQDHKKEILSVNESSDRFERFKTILETLQQNDVSFDDALELDLETIKSCFEEPDEALFNQFWEALQDHKKKILSVNESSDPFERFKTILETLQKNDVSFDDALEFDLDTIKSCFEEPDEALFNQFWGALQDHKNKLQPRNPIVGYFSKKRYFTEELTNLLENILEKGKISSLDELLNMPKDRLNDLFLSISIDNQIKDKLIIIFELELFFSNLNKINKYEENQLYDDIIVASVDNNMDSQKLYLSFKNKTIELILFLSFSDLNKIIPKSFLEFMEKENFTLSKLQTFTQEEFLKQKLEPSTISSISIALENAKQCTLRNFKFLDLGSRFFTYICSNKITFQDIDNMSEQELSEKLSSFSTKEKIYQLLKRKSEFEICIDQLNISLPEDSDLKALKYIDINTLKTWKLNEFMKVKNKYAKSYKEMIERLKSYNPKKEQIVNKAMQLLEENLCEKCEQKPIEIQDKPIEIQDKSIEIQDKSLEIQDKSIEIQDKSLEIQDKSFEIQDKSLEIQDKSFEIQDNNSFIKSPQKIEADLYFCLEDGIKMTDCAEKYFNYLTCAIDLLGKSEEQIYLFRAEFLKKNSINANFIKNELLNKENIQLYYFKYLKEYLEIEGQLTSEIKREIEETISLFNEGELVEALELIKKVFKKYRILNFQELLRLITNVNSVGNYIKGKNIILLLGDTGAGKSTFIQFLLGMRMQKKLVDGMQHIEGDLDEFLSRKDRKINSNDEAEIFFSNEISKIKSSCFMKSETKCLNGVRLSVDEENSEDGFIILCDTPGFRDSSGTEVDIANGISIIKAVHLARSVRPVILMSAEGFGDRGQEIKKYASTITSIIPEIKDLSNRINFIFTKYKTKNFNGLKSKIDNLVKNFDHKVSHTNRNFFGIIQRKLKTVTPEYLIFEPLKNDPKAFLKYFFDNEAIKDPQKNFEYFMAPQSINEINDQFSIHHNIIDNCLSQNKFGIVKFKLEEMKLISRHTYQKNLEDKYENTLRKITKNFEEKYDSLKKEITYVLKLENNLESEKYSQIKQTIDLLINSEIFCDFIQEGKLSYKTKIENFIKEQLKIMTDEIQNINFGDFKLYYLVSNLKEFCLNFPDYSNFSEETVNYLRNKFKNSYEEIDNLFKEVNNPFNFGSFKKMIEKLSENFEKFEEFIQYNEEELHTIENLKDKLIAFYNRKLSNTKKILNKIHDKEFRRNNITNQGYSEEDNLKEYQNEQREVDSINDFFEEIANNIKIKIFIKNKELVEIGECFSESENKLISLIEEEFNKLENKLLQSIKDHDFDNFNLAGKYVKRMELMTKINKTASSLYSKFQSNIDKTVESLKVIEKGIIKSLEDKFINGNLNTTTGKNFLKNFEKCLWIKDYRDYEIDRSKEKIEEIVLGQMHESLDNIRNAEISFDNLSNLQPLQNSYEKLMLIKELFSEYKTIIEEVDEPIKNFQDTFKTVYDEIQRVIKRLSYLNCDPQNFNKVSENENEDVKHSNNPFEKFLQEVNALYDLEKSINFMNAWQKLYGKNKINKDESCDFEGLKREIKIMFENFSYYWEGKLKEIFSSIESIIKTNFFIRNSGVGISIDEELNESFVSVLSSDSIINEKLSGREKSTKDLKRNYCKLINQLIELMNFYKHLYTKHQTLYNLIDKKNYMKENIEKYVREIHYMLDEKENEENMEIKTLRFKINLIIEASNIDKLNFSETLENFKFNSLYIKNKDKLGSEINNIKYDLEESLNRCDYLEVQKSLKKINDPNDKISYKILQTIKHKIKAEVENRLKTIDKLSLHFLSKEDKNYEYAIELSKNLYEVNQLMKLDDCYLIERNTMERKLCNSKNNIIKAFESELKSLISQHGFDINVRISHMTSIIEDIKNHFEDKDSQDGLKKLENDLISFPEDLKNKYSNKINELKSKELKLLINEPINNLKEILEKSNLPCLCDLRNELLNVIKQKIEESKQKLDSPMSQNQFNELFRDTQNCLKFLDEDDKNFYNTELENSKTRFDSRILDEAQNINYSAENNDHLKLYDLACKIKNRNDVNSENYHKIKDLINSKATEQLNLLLKENKIVRFFEIFDQDLIGILNFSQIFPNEVQVIFKYQNNLDVRLEEIKKTQENLEYFNEDVGCNTANGYENDHLEYIFSKLNENHQPILLEKIRNSFLSLREDMSEKTLEIINCLKIMKNKGNFCEAIEKISNKEGFDSNMTKHKMNVENFIKFFKKFKEIASSFLDKLIKDFKKNSDLLQENYLNKFKLKKVLILLLRIFILDESYSIFKYSMNQIDAESLLPKETLELLKNEINYDIHCRKISDFLIETSKYFEHLDIINISRNKSELDQTVSEVESKLTILNSILYLNQIPNFSMIEEDLRKKSIKLLEDKLSNFEKEIIRALKLLNINTLSSEQDSLIYGWNFFYDLSRKSQELKSITKTFIQTMENFIEYRFKEITNILENSFEEKNLQEISDSLILLKMFAEICQDNNNNLYENKFLNILQNLHKSVGALKIAKIGFLLERHPIGTGIIKSSKIFQGYEISIFNSRTRTHDEKYVVENLEIEHNNSKVEPDQKLILEKYQIFLKHYNDVLKKNLSAWEDCSDEDSQCEKIIFEIKEKFNRTKKDLFKKSATDFNWIGIIDLVPKLLAYIFVLWTLLNSKTFFEAAGSEDQDNYLLKPHPSQVISIFRILKVDKKENLENHLVQIKTGEGKSLVLGVLSAFFALLDINVYVACYSKYLSERDFNYFEKIFTLLGVYEKVKYGTFNALCEESLKNHLDIREVITDFLMKSRLNPNLPPPDKQRNILLIDEVDVFFSKDFYGNSYCPSIKLSHPTISILLDKIWSLRNNMTFQDVEKFKQSQEYLNCLNEFKNHSKLIEYCIANAIIDLINYKDHEYILMEDKIGYKEQGNIVINKNYGYKTLFAYYTEHEKNNIDIKTLGKNKALIVQCGIFAYAEIPKMFNNILGVTGTLKTLSAEENSIITNDYKINHKTFSPSVYGKSLDPFDKEKGFLVVNEKDYFLTISNHIENGLSGRLKGIKRAVLVFFESKKILEEFYKSTYFSKFKEEANVLTEETDNKEKERIIRNSTRSGYVTLLTKVFSRGTDFISSDENVIKQGGVHVIDTSFSEQISEEIQTIGRTSRQGQEGSYELIVVNNHLEKFRVNQDFWKSNTKITYKLLNSLREEFIKKEFESNKKKLEESSKKHIESMDFLKNIQKGNELEMKKFLNENNFGELNGLFNNLSRTLILLDATCSMDNLLENCKHVIENMFDRINSILSDKKNHTGFEIQIAVYRNYNVDSDLVLEHSSWEARPDNLRTFLQKLKTAGGLGEEAIELGLYHANVENDICPISQVILIGDMPSNSSQQVLSKRKTNSGLPYWDATKYAHVTDYKEELKKLKNKEVPVNTFYLDDTAKENFEEIARETGGKYFELKMSSGSKGAEKLTEIICTNVLRNVCKISNEDPEEFVKEYSRRFACSYS